MIKKVCLVLCLLFGFYLGTAQSQSALQTLANSLQPGQWGKLTGMTGIASNGGTIFDGGEFGNDACVILQYSDKAVWDSQAKKLYFQGTCHAGPPSTTFVRYDEATNSWTRLTPTLGSHAYEHHAIDPVHRKLYYVNAGDLTPYRYDLDAGTWDHTMPVDVVGYDSLFNGITWFPEMDSLLHLESAVGQVTAWNRATNSWRSLVDSLDMQGANYSGFIQYNAVNHVVLFGGGNNSNNVFGRTVRTINAAGTIVRKTDAPFDIGPTSGGNPSVVVQDPASGKMLVFKNQGAPLFYSFDIPSNTWTQESTVNVPLFAPCSTVFNIVATPIDNYGVMLFLKYCNSTNVDAWIYKYGPAVIIPPQPEPPPSGATTIFGTMAPTTFTRTDAPAEVGVKFRSDVNGAIVGIRFYKVSGDTNGHTGSLWSSNGTLLATGSFANETASGWQELTFAAPVMITANTTYVASYHEGGTLYYSQPYFANMGVDNPPLHALRSGVDGLNGVYRYGSGGLFPNLSYNTSNYWADVMLATGPPSPNKPPIVNAGNDQMATGGFSASFTLTGTATDDPSQPLTYLWTKTDGPGTVTFVNAASASTVTTVNSPGTYTFNFQASDGQAASNDVIVVTVADSSSNTPVPSPPIASDFQARCSAPGVVKCVGFDQAADVAGRYPAPVGLLPSNAGSFPQLDTSVKASGNSSLKFTIPPMSSSDAAGSYFANFSNDFSVQFDAGDTFYYQWRQRFSPEFLTLPGAGWKQTIMGTGSTGTLPGWPGIASSCTSLEIVTVNGYMRGFAQMYNSCSGSTSHGPYAPFEEPFGNDFKLQNARPVPYCLYTQTHTIPSTALPPTGNCFGYFANEWMTFQIGVTLGPRVGDEFKNSHIQMWAAREGQPSQLLQDWIFNLTAGSPTSVPLEKFGQIWFTPYMTGKDATLTNPIAYTWYDELIVSRNKIADPAAASVPAPPDPCISDPLTISGLKWPAARTGTRSLTWNSVTKEIVMINYQWPANDKQTAIFMDKRNCKASFSPK